MSGVRLMWAGERRLAALLRATPGVDAAVAEAMIAVRRHRFVDWRWRHRAYQDRSLPTGAGTSISQPSYIARVLSAARVQAADEVLEVGAGSGYTAAVLAELARQVTTVERVPALAARARHCLRGERKVRVVQGDGCHAVAGNFDVILVMAGAPAVPAPYRERLRDGGRLIIPVGPRLEEAAHGRVLRVTRRGVDFDEEDLMAGDWNLLTGRDGWND
jgi:protein-L-isoaspartate(D-aspartate) O-methyltransferase